MSCILFCSCSQKTEGQDIEAAKDTRKSPAAMAPGAGYGITREPVVELLTREAFYTAIKLVQPYLTLHEMDSMFDEAIDISQAEVLRNLEFMWVKCVEQQQQHNQRGREHRAKSEDAGDFSMHSRSRVNSMDSMHSIDEGPSSHGRAKSAPAPREFYVNALNPLHTQWTKAITHSLTFTPTPLIDTVSLRSQLQPYSQKTFRSQDIEINAFVLVLIRRDIFIRRSVSSALYGFLTHLMQRPGPLPCVYAARCSRDCCISIQKICGPTRT